jgi:transcriptional activator SPT8
MTTIDSQTQDSSILQPKVVDSDAHSDASFDPLFDDDPEEPPHSLSTIPTESKLAMPGGTQTQHPLPPPRPTTSIPPPKNAPPLLDPTSYSTYSPELLLTASIDGQVILWDRRVQTSGTGVGRLGMSEKTPPWCLSVRSFFCFNAIHSWRACFQACWSADGAQIYAGRRNGTVDVWDARLLGKSGPLSTPRLFKTLRNPTSSGVVSCVVAFPDCRHIAR